ncbi:hypothetical protein BGX28_010292 [Mortierella sp. GBA30]|nr:hypothetical protein BGX28_010292 [Mortierella sp. GBA30]
MCDLVLDDDEEDMRTNDELFQNALQWANLLDGTREEPFSFKGLFEHGVIDAGRKLGLTFFVGMIPGGNFLVSAPLSYFKVYRPLMMLKMQDSQREILQKTMSA